MAKTAQAYGVLGEKIPNYLFAEQAAAGLYSTVTDFARFIEENIRVYRGDGEGSPIISKNSLLLAYTPVKKDYGMGYIIKVLPDRTRLILHGGANRGWRSQFALLPERGDGLVVLTNSDNGEYLHRDLLSLWVRGETGYWPAFHTKDLVLRTVVKTLATALLLLLLLRVRGAVLAARGKRLAARGNAVGGVLGLVVGCLLAVLPAAAWWTLFYNGAVYGGWKFASFMPAGFTWLTVAVLCWSVFLLAMRVLDETGLGSPAAPGGEEDDVK
jgi:hypothetical protein